MESPAEHPVLAIDLGGTQIRTAVITPDGAVHARRAEPTRDEDGVASVLRRIVALAAATRAEAMAAGIPAPMGAAISAPGPLDPWRGIVVAPPNLKRWRNVPLRDVVADGLALPAFLERDTNVAARAEWRYGAARGTRDLVYVTVSTGIGAGVVVDGRPLVGALGTAGELGHLVVDLDGPRCGCGGLGHVEAIASGTALARLARELLDAGRAPRLAAMAAGGASVDAELVARAADAGDEACREVLERAWVGIGGMCASIVNAFNPEVIVIGGGIAEHHPRLFEVARAELERRALPMLVDSVRIEPAVLGRDVSLIGALPIVHDRIGDSDLASGSQRPQPVAPKQQGAVRP